jgi:hypothetical protein
MLGFVPHPNLLAHTAGTTTVTVATTGVYWINFGVNLTDGPGSSISIAVNGTVDASTNILVIMNHVSGSALLSLVAGDVLTLRNNSATAFTLDLSPGVGAHLILTFFNNIQ